MVPTQSHASGDSDRVEAERERYDRQYAERWEGLDLRVAEGSEYHPNDLRRATLYALDQLGDVTGARVLELGAGSGVDSLMLVRRNADVTATDVAEGALTVIRRRFAANATPPPTMAAMPAERLDLPDASFDRIFARGVLHHADVSAAAPEMARVLKPDGRAVFIEPLSENPLLDFAREHLWYPGKTRPRGHRGIRYSTIRVLQREFGRASVRGFYLTSMLNRAFGFGVELGMLERFDEWLLKRVPTFQRLCRYVVVTCELDRNSKR